MRIKHYLRIIFLLCGLVNFNGILAQESQPLVKPPYLQKGDTVAIVAPASFLKDSTLIQNGIQLFEDWGLNVVIGKHVFDIHNHFAGTDENRARDVQWALDNPSVKAIWCARGGYGTNRVLTKLDFTTFKQHPKWVIGYSDITVLHNTIHNLGVETIHAFMATSKATIEHKKVTKTLKKALFGDSLHYKISSNEQNIRGEATGVLVGGNLSLLASLLGTPYSIDTNNKILFIEDIGEYLYRIDRMLLSLKLAGYFENCKAVLIGGMTDIPENDPKFGMTIEEIVLDIVGKNIPIAFDIPVGHIEKNNTLIFGNEVTVSIDKKHTKLTFSK